MQRISFRFDPRLNSTAELIVHANERLSRGKSLSRRDLVPINADPQLITRATGILRFFGYIESVGKSHTYRRCKPSLRHMIRKAKALHLVFWHLTSKWYPVQHRVMDEKKEIVRILKEFGFPEDYYPGIQDCIAATPYASGIRDRRGGFELCHPAEIPDAKRMIGQQSYVFGRTTEWIVNDEYDLYEDNNRPLVRFFAKLHGHKWTVNCDKRGGKSRRETMQEPDHGLWQNPDIRGFRGSDSDNIGTYDVEMFAVEVKLDFHPSGIAEAESFFEFANFAYLAVKCSIAEVLRKRRLHRLAAEKGVGIVALSLPDYEDSWVEILPARYRSQRHSNTVQAIRELGLGQVSRLNRNEGQEKKRA